MIELTGTVSGTARRHTPESLQAAWEHAFLVLPDARGGFMETRPVDVTSAVKCPTMLFAHGSSGITDAIRDFARWAAVELKAAVAVPDSFQLADRLTYTSPVARDVYEVVHAMRSAELQYAARRLAEAPWFDGRYVVAGTSEGGVAAARFDREAAPVKEAGRLIFSWSCEDNYHVAAHASKLPDDLPVLNGMSLADKFFSRANPYLDNPAALGCAANVLRHNPASAIVLIPDAPHTLLNLPQTRAAVAAFVKRLGF